MMITSPENIGESKSSIINIFSESNEGMLLFNGD